MRDRERERKRKRRKRREREGEREDKLSRNDLKQRSNTAQSTTSLDTEYTSESLLHITWHCITHSLTLLLFQVKMQSNSWPLPIIYSHSLLSSALVQTLSLSLSFVPESLAADRTEQSTADQRHADRSRSSSSTIIIIITSIISMRHEMCLSRALLLVSRKSRAPELPTLPLTPSTHLRLASTVSASASAPPTQHALPCDVRPRPVCPSVRSFVRPFVRVLRAIVTCMHSVEHRRQVSNVTAHHVHSAAT